MIREIVHSEDLDRDEYLAQHGIEITLYKGTPFTGTEIFYFDNGCKCYEVEYEEGIRHGRKRSWHLNGNLKEEIFYENDAIKGISREWHENEQLQKEYNYETGEVKKWDALGNLIYNKERRITYSVTGSYIEREWYPTGGLKREMEVDQSQPLFDRVVREWYQNGQQKSEKKLEADLVVEGTEWDETGNLIKAEELTEKDFHYNLMIERRVQRKEMVEKRQKQKEQK